MQCPKFEQLATITLKRYEIGCQLLLITNKKSHTGFRLVLTSVTLNNHERRNSPYFAFFLPISIGMQAVIEDRPIMSVKYCLPVPVFHIWPKLMHPAARSLCNSWASCCYIYLLYCSGYILLLFLRAQVKYNKVGSCCWVDLWSPCSVLETNFVQSPYPCLCPWHSSPGPCPWP